jgi:hypothetical protein
MGKDSVVFKETREKVSSRAGDRKFGRNKIDPNQAKKNISKKDLDKLRRVKMQEKAQKLASKKQKREQDSQINQQLHAKAKQNISLKERRQTLLKDIQERRKKNHGAQGEDEDWEDVDEHEKEVFATTGYFDVPDTDAVISKEDQKLLNKMST